MTGSPEAMASSATSPQVSVAEGKTKRSASAYRSASVSRDRKPQWCANGSASRTRRAPGAVAGDNEASLRTQDGVGGSKRGDQRVGIFLHCQSADVEDQRGSRRSKPSAADSRNVDWVRIDDNRLPVPRPSRRATPWRRVRPASPRLASEWLAPAGGISAGTRAPDRSPSLPGIGRRSGENQCETM